MVTSSMTRQDAISHAIREFDTGLFQAGLAALVALPTESQNPARRPELQRYLDFLRTTHLEPTGFTCESFSKGAKAPPFLIATRHDTPGAPTVLVYGHGDVIHGQEDRWSNGRSPWKLDVDGERWYGRGTADNKGQHFLNIQALKHVIDVRGTLGFNVTLLLDTCEEIGSPGLREFCCKHRAELAGDVLIASDGPRLDRDLPSIYLGTRGALNFTIAIRLRDGGHHSGNWGGYLRDPGIRLAHALASITDAQGKILVPEWRPTSLTPDIRELLASCPLPANSDPPIDTDWGEPGLTPQERVYGWNSFAVLAVSCGNPRAPVNAIQPEAVAHCQLRFVVGTDPEDILPALRRHLKHNGFADVVVAETEDNSFAATRTSAHNRWVRFAASSIERSTGLMPAILPNAGGSLPNDIFTQVLGLPTVWVPHSYPGCSQHAPDEHALAPLLREGLEIMTGLFWDIGENTESLI